MKHTAIFSFLTIIFLALVSCQDNPSGSDSTSGNAPSYDTIVEVRIDTIITFDPKTYVETVSIERSYDTIILMNGEKVDLKVTRPVK